MKRTAQLILAVCLVIAFSGFVFADSHQYFQLIGREISPGISVGGKTVGAVFLGKFFDQGYTKELGQFSVCLDHNGEGIEVCGAETELIRFKLIMSFNAGGRLVLVGPQLGPADIPPVAQWDWDNPGCPNGNCPLIDYGSYIVLLSQLTDPQCSQWGDSDEAFIAKVTDFDVARQWLGSYGVGFRGGSVSGWLVHTPVISPAIFGTVDLD
jgi:hypothetical protein